MKKNERITAFVADLGASAPPAPMGLDPHYTGYFTCFNQGQYYEAHDVLEQLWLREEGPAAGFYKALIQIAGAFVHLRKHHLRPDHPKDGARLRPAVRLFALAERNLEPYRARFLQLDVEGLVTLCQAWTGEISASAFTRNPWSPDRLPQLRLSGEL